MIIFTHARFFLDSDGNQVVEYAYEAWGKVELVSGTMSSTLGHLNPFRYRCYYYDEESGLYYLNGRYYDPEIGRMVNADCIILCKFNNKSLLLLQKQSRQIY